MRGLTEKQLNEIPWISRYSSQNALQEPPLSQIGALLDLPFLKRPRKYNLFFIWSEIISLIPEKRCRILDCASGLGQISQALYFKGHDVTACDVDDNFKGSDQIPFKIVDLNLDFPYEDEQFDVVLISTALHYLDNQKHFFDESRRILKKGGLLIFTTPNLGNLNSKRRFLDKGELFDYGSINRPSVLYFPFFSQYLDKKGFKIENIRGSTALKSFRLSLFRFLNYPFIRLSGNEISDYSSTLIYQYRKSA